ncbi:AlkZ-related protein [Pseudobdellovibrio exovorus]|uniref:Uncharacterized protein n=1 Tax=Pseudobdellovibrio exovorus JSS TaxID=1184267 RepID=M4VAF7_9BACT|nr:hypothetical protein [Pseudobdellovibrio exovorus]AGH95455.1 hypothetical protein A11Q_1239 [Pseudobdellovibrio exovorus JSS]
MSFKKAVEKINQRGVLLTFPVNNKPEPKSLWSEFFPKSKMEWDWNEDADSRVSTMWVLMKKLSDSREVVYSKWYQGRATFFSRSLFTALLRLSNMDLENPQGLSREARQLLSELENDSPLSTKQLKKLTELQGKDNESCYQRAMKSLFLNFLIVGFGEVDDGAFPSLAVGATRHLYEDLCADALNLSNQEAQERLDQYMPTGSVFRKFYDKNILKSC